MSYSGVYDVEFLLMRDARKWKWVVYAAKSLSHSFNNDDAAKSQLEMNKTSLMVRSWQWNFHSALISIAFRFSSAESWVTWLLDESASIAVGGSFQLQKCKKCRNARNWPIKRTTLLKISCVTLRDYYIKYCLLHLQEENPQDRKVMRVRRCDGVPPSRWDPVSHWHSPGTFLTENSQSSFYVSTPGGWWVPDRGLSIVLDLKVVCSWWVFKQFCPQTRTHSQREIPHQKIICKRAALTDLTHRDRSGAL